ncbi:S9 family peptidase [Pontixanthobacter gangjinensis]|uniref:Prolyl oligopeptidase family serine peptidase n=1 Tax=Pontixanthobacter gangjinensis TaxID=1028742 RepID=A0A6I4SNA1_9SPHN|nr:alpha/beta fold hydrolase [Pontixanthobacter gangjinensis]MXO56620.1 prolyl oligopeptidase family serine peptidase [Pontixanthobacter gangjinensis]
MFNAKLSPDGSKFAYQIIDDDRIRIAVFDAETRQAIKTVDLGKGAPVAWFRWAGNDRVLFSLHSRAMLLLTFVPATRLMLHDLVKDETSFVGLDDQGFKGDDVLYVDPAGEFVLLSLKDKAFSQPSVYRFDLDGKGATSARIVQKRTLGIEQWWTDNTGVVRLGMKRQGSKRVSFFYRSNAAQELVEVAKLRREADAFDNWDVLSIRAGSDTGYALVKDERGLNILREFNYRTSMPGEEIFAHPEWGLESAVFENDGTLQAANFTDDFPNVYWFDPDMAAIQDKLERTLKTGQVQILSSSGSDRMLVSHSAGDDPGVVYIYTPARNKLDVFGELRPDIDFKQLTAPQSIEYPARDGTRIRGYLTLPKGRAPTALPLIIMPHGGPYGIRDTASYRDEVQLLANRGYAILQPNYRGSGGYGEKFEDLGNGQIGRMMQDDLDDAMDWAVAQGFADPDRVCLVGASYGGYASLWGVTRNPERYRCAASWAGVTDFEAQVGFDRGFFTRRNNKKWQRRVQGDEPDFKLGLVSPLQQIGMLTRPILLAHGKRDRTVPFSQFTMMSDAAKTAEVDITELVLDDAGHSFSKVEDEQKWYDALIAFLARTNPSDVNVAKPADISKEGDSKTGAQVPSDGAEISTDATPETIITEPDLAG